MKKQLTTNLAVLSLLIVPLLGYSAEKVDKTLDVLATPNVNIDIKRGNVQIQSWAENKIQVVGTLDELSEGLIFKREGDTIFIEDELPHVFHSNNDKGSQLTIKVPGELRIDVDGISSDFKVSKLEGEITIESVSGNIEASQLFNQPELHSVSGNIVAKDLSGNVRLSSVSGDIKDDKSRGNIHYKLVSGKLNASSNAKDIEIEQVSGEIEVNFPQVKQLQIKSVSGDLDADINGDIRRLRVESVSGDIALNFDKNTSLTFEADGGPSGEIQNDLTNDNPKKARYTGSESIYFTTGSANGSARINTVSGSVTFKASGIVLKKK
ncbi:MAG: DUF4097 domain-containing protein [Shewanella sp.]|nr:DUF4097 domain-containing protein [Shewanella sp.]